MRVLSIVALMFGLLSGCVTPYQPKSFSGGYSESQLGTNMFTVAFQGNGNTSYELAADFCLLRSAEITLENGFRYFVVVESYKDFGEFLVTKPTQSYTTWSIYASGNFAHGNARTATYGGQTYFISTPSTENTILCFKDKPEVDGLLFDAEFVAKTIRKKYNMSDKMTFPRQEPGVS
jgi:hypothetical protein